MLVHKPNGPLTLLRRVLILAFVGLTIIASSGLKVGSVTEASTSAQRRQESADEVWRQYSRGEFGRASELLKAVSDWSLFVQDVEARMLGWPPSEAAAFALEVASAEFDSLLLESVRFSSSRVMELGARLCFRSEVPEAFAVAWHLAAASLLQNLGSEYPNKFVSPLSERVVDPGFRRLSRFPEIQLSAAHLKTREVHYDFAEGWFTTAGRAFNQKLGHLNSDPNPANGGLYGAIQRFASLRKMPSVRAEAALQLGFLEMLAGRPPVALEYLEEVESLTADAWLLYNARFLTAQILTRLGRLNDAASAYRGALHVVPDGNSAMRSLAALLYVVGDRATARTLLGQIAQNQTFDDPWPQFAFGDARLWPSRRDRIRSLR